MFHVFVSPSPAWLYSSSSTSLPCLLPCSTCLSLLPLHIPLPPSSPRLLTMFSPSSTSTLVVTVCSSSNADLVLFFLFLPPLLLRLLLLLTPLCFCMSQFLRLSCFISVTSLLRVRSMRPCPRPVPRSPRPRPGAMVQWWGGFPPGHTAAGRGSPRGRWRPGPRSRGRPPAAPSWSWLQMQCYVVS